MLRSELELMAPAGSRESLVAARQGGADAVYFGIEGLNMRSRAGANFSLADLTEIAAWCRDNGMRSYLTVNTIIYDDDIDYMRRIVDGARAAGITAIIATDIATIAYARTVGQPVHISTQVNVSNTEAVRFYSQWADVMVLARELTLDRVAAIHRAIERDGICGPQGEPVRLEMFCHGALCMAVSGKCYMSLHECGTSANRGECRQVCRRSYLLTDRDTGDELVIDRKYIMSPKDLKTIHFLNKMVDAGVRVFKIEGRARGPEYVRTVASCYDEALRAIADGTYGSDPSQISGWDARLATVFNRGFWNGYYLGQRLGEWTDKYGSSATRVKRYAARATRYYPRLGVAEFLVEAGEVAVGDEAVIIGPTTGAVPLTVAELRLDVEPVPKAVKGQLFSVKTPERVRPGDRLYLWTDADA